MLGEKQMEEMSELALVDVFEPMPDSRRKQGNGVLLGLARQ